jgi:hypothetical protein
MTTEEAQRANFELGEHDCLGHVLSYLDTYRKGHSLALGKALQLNRVGSSHQTSRHHQGE